MNEFVFFFNMVVVFLVPCVFGWTVLRRLAREHDPIILGGGAVVLGFTAVMVLVNELRYWLEMSPATWFTYKILLAATLVILVFSRKPGHDVALPKAGQGRVQLATVILGTIITAAYFSTPAFKGLLNDAWWFHYPMAVQIQTTAHFPLQHPMAIDDPLYYHFGPDILAATWAYLLDQPVAKGFALNVLWFAPATFLLSYGLVLRLSRQYVAALAAASFVVVGGNLRFFNLLGADLDSATARLQVFNSQTIQGMVQMVFTPSHAVGIPLTLLTLCLYRHLLMRFNWTLTALTGLCLGSLTLVAEWYFFPLSGAIALSLLIHRRRRIRAFRTASWLRYAAPLIIAVACGMFNNTYVAGLFGRYWMHYTPIHHTAAARVVDGALKPNAVPSDFRDSSLLEDPAANNLRDGFLFEGEAPPPPVRAVIPNLIPLRINLNNFGEVPSWEKAGSNDSSWIPLWSWSFISEALPAIAIGLPFGFWLWRRTGNLLLLTFVSFACFSLCPPLLLDWGYRSTDFLRFFTGAFSFSALLLGWLIGHLTKGPVVGWKLVGITLSLLMLVNAAGLGVLGLLPGTLDLAKQVSDQGISLSQATTDTRSEAVEAPIQADATFRAKTRAEAFQLLARQLDQFLFPLTKGRGRALVIVPPEQLPPQVVFHEWMKLTAMSRVLMPIGWYWNDSLYSSYCQKVMTSLDHDALAALGVNWIIETNLWDYTPPPAVERELNDVSRFRPVVRWRESDYYLSLYHRQ
jgi:hypothetical protein